VVFLPEGEKAADAARSIGLTATTSAGGAKAPAKTDWTPLAGKQVVILPDNDAAGREYAAKATAILTKLAPPVVVKVLELPNLPDGGDIVDWIAAHAGTEHKQLRQRIEAMVEQAEVVAPMDNAAPLERYEPFPTDVLPQPVRAFVEQGAEAIGCDPVFIALPMLSALAAAIGTTRCIRLKATWTEPAIIWGETVAASGERKSPPLELALENTTRRQHMAVKAYQRAMAEYEEKLQQWERDRRRGDGDDDPSPKPAEPHLTEFWMTDATIEAVAPMLDRNPRGVLLAPDELRAWFGSLDRYNRPSGGDAAHWLMMHGGRPLKINRKTDKRVYYIPRAAVSITGTIQPDTLRRVLRPEYLDNGLAARFLLAMPMPRPVRWTENVIDPAVKQGVSLVFDRLFDLSPASGADVDDPEPLALDLSPDAKVLWISFYNEHNTEAADMTGAEAAAWRKLEGYAARLALVVHLTRCAAEPTLGDAVDADSIATGIRLSRWFGREARRVYAMLSETDEQREVRHLHELVQRKGGTLTPRELMRSSRRYNTADAAEAALGMLAQARLGHWHDDDHGGGPGHPAHRFVLFDARAVDTNSADASGNGHCVNVNGVVPLAPGWREV
jgi:hypothetical protein